MKRKKTDRESLYKMSNAILAMESCIEGLCLAFSESNRIQEINEILCLTSWLKTTFSLLPENIQRRDRDFERALKAHINAFFHIRQDIEKYTGVIK